MKYENIFQMTSSKFLNIQIDVVCILKKTQLKNRIVLHKGSVRIQGKNIGGLQHLWSY